jgi:hypothetical protein
MANDARAIILICGYIIVNSTLIGAALLMTSRQSNQTEEKDIEQEAFMTHVFLKFNDEKNSNW